MTTSSIRISLALLAGCLIMLTACEGEREETTPVPDGAMESDAVQDTVEMAHAELMPTEGHNVSGTVHLTETPGGVRVVATITGLGEGAHGFHVHEHGDCSAPDASSAGDHFAGSGQRHGAPTDPESERHAGDLGNLEADASGTANYERVDNVMSLRGPHSVVGKAVVVHENPDDLESQPSGNAGARVACGVIMSDRGMQGMGSGG